MRLVVGLGNPGTRYRDTPHNAGFRVCDLLATRHGLGPEAHRYQGAFRRGRIAGVDVGLLKPETYMNLSGESVAEALRYLPIDPGDVILVYDELDLPAGRIRIRPGGSPAGHKGVLSVVEKLGTKAIPRVRIGVGRPAERGRESGHLLGKVPADQREIFEKAVERGADAVEAMLELGVKEAMNRFNGLPALGQESPPETAPA
jgi:PTH1 family peptidyl-tRNA hydrolase